MDHMNLLPNNPQRLDMSRDLLQTAPGGWVIHSHTTSISQWSPQPLPLGPFYFAHQPAFQLPPAGLGPMHPMHPVQHGALPHPDRSMRGLQNPETMQPILSGATYWNPPLQPMPRMSGPEPINNSGTSAGSTLGLSTPGGGFANPSTNARDLTLRPPDWASPGTTSGTHSVSPTHLASSESLSSASEHRFPSFPLSPISPRRTGHNSSTSPYRSSHRPQPSNSALSQRDNAGLPTPAPDRRRQAFSRTRRSLGSRHSGSDLTRIQDDTATQHLPGESPTTRSNRRANLNLTAAQMEDTLVRQLQMFRGSVHNKMVASKAALQSLESVATCSLPDNERTCVICYNDYGTASPEGINEAPLRLPQCKHIFGDHCIKKWLEDSDSCPYCRSKLHSEPKQCSGSARAFIQMMRLRGLPLPNSVSEELISRASSRPVGEVEMQEYLMRAARTAERRSPPDDASGQDQRRIRQRRSSSGVAVEVQPSNTGGVHPYATPDGPASGSTSQSAGNMWTATTTPANFAPTEPFHSQLPSRPDWEGLGQNSVANGRRGAAVEPAASRPRPQRTDHQGTVIANGSSIPPPTMANPLQRSFNQQRAGISIQGGAATSAASSTTRSDAAPAANSPTVEVESSPPRPFRNRPW